MKILMQIALVFGVCLLGEGIALLLPIPFPASVIAMVLLFLLLVCRVIKPDHIREKARFLSANMAFFFIPAGVGIMEQYPLIREHLPALLLICLITTVLTFGATALTVKGVLCLQRRLGAPGAAMLPEAPEGAVDPPSSVGEKAPASSQDAGKALSPVPDGEGIACPPEETDRSPREGSPAARRREKEGAV